MSGGCLPETEVGGVKISIVFPIVSYCRDQKEPTQDVVLVCGLF